ncbi:MAG: ATP synthase F1 subunit delta [Bacteroidales bacterium]|jgi:F-type H+-transporting ATPase subunit delta|nr:ATP synthase F1 subunit delta [Bacteroidales bacterium]
MNNSIVSNRYAKAMFMVGVDHKCLEELRADMALLSVTIKDNPMFVQLLDSPVIKPGQKLRVMGELLQKRVHPLTLNFINILIKNKREIMLSDIAREFAGLYEKHKGIKQAHIISSSVFDEVAKENLRKQLNVMYDADIQLTSEVNPELIGGFILRVDDQQYDASIASSLKRMKKRLISS